MRNFNESGLIAFLKQHLHFGERKNQFTNSKKIWQLFLGGSLLGTLKYSGYETPWTTCSFFPTEKFARYIPYFEYCKLENANLDNDKWEDNETWQAVEHLYDEIQKKGDLKIEHIVTNENWRPSIHFGNDYSFAWFR